MTLKLSTFLILFCSASISWSQPDTLNQKVYGKKQAYWIIFGKDYPERGYCDTCKIEEGMYKDDRKTGLWIKYHKTTNTIRLKGNYVNGRPNGEYWMYYENGDLKEHGHFLELKTRNFEIYYKSGCLKESRNDTSHIYYKDDCVLMKSKKGTEIEKSEIGTEYNYPNPFGRVLATGDTIKYYYADGTYQLIKYKSKDSTVITETFYECGEIKKRVEHIASNMIIDQKDYEQSDSCKAFLERKYPPGEGGPEGKTGVVKGKKKFEEDGHNKVYNRFDEIWMDGEFKSGKLWNGMLYKYDSDEILLKVEIWKNGSYVRDGQL